MEIRPYVAADLADCRGLHEELVGHHREIYDAPHIGGDEPALGFDDYLALPERVATWVAIDDDCGIVGMTGLLWSDGEATIEPVVVADGSRGVGTGRRLIETAITEARSRGAKDVNVSPVARNESAIRAFHHLGFRTLGHVQMFMRLEVDESTWRAEIEVHGRHFNY